MHDLNISWENLGSHEQQIIIMQIKWQLVRWLSFLSNNLKEPLMDTETQEFFYI